MSHHPALKPILSKLNVLALAAACVFFAGQAQAIDTQAREAILVDIDTGAVLFEKSADVLMPPASMSKIMTVYLAFERLANGSLTLDSEIPISEKSWRKGGSKMFVEVNSRVKIADILRGIIVQSGNDAAIALAEGLAGSEEAFAEEMTEKARELGMDSTTFRNATGWPDPEHRTTARDLSILASETIRRFPDYYPIYAEKTFTYNKIKQGNRNPLLYKGMGADGLKTGHTEEAGYGLTASVIRNGRRLVLVANGMKSVKARSSESQKLLEWGFREYDNFELFKKGEEVEQALVWLGDQKTVPLVIGDDLTLTLSRKNKKKMKVTVEYNEPIPAPIVAGSQLATLKIARPDKEVIEIPLLAGADVGQLGLVSRVTAAIGFLLWGG